MNGRAAGVPFVMLAPGRGERADAPVVLCWNLTDPPRTAPAFASALPLTKLDAWRVYLELPMCGSRMPKAMSRRYNVTYSWSPESNALAERIDYVARADEIVTRASATDVLIVVGSEDDPGIVEPAKALASRLSNDTQFRGRSRIEVIPGMAHALSDEPGFEPAPQTTHAAAVDGMASAWFADAFDRGGKEENV
jgi:hypothetical protein